MSTTKKATAKNAFVKRTVTKKTLTPAVKKTSNLTDKLTKSIATKMVKDIEEGSYRYQSYQALSKTGNREDAIALLVKDGWDKDDAARYVSGSLRGIRKFYGNMKAA